MTGKEGEMLGICAEKGHVTTRGKARQGERPHQRRTCPHLGPGLLGPEL